jgi:hypothetical protein
MATARAHLIQALDIYRRIGSPRADDVTAWLTAYRLLNA